MNIFVGIASSGRNAVLQQTLESIGAQTLPPTRILVCTPRGDEGPKNLAENLQVTLLQADRGSCAQRNAILDALQTCEGALLFLDDDFVLHPRYLEEIEKIFAKHPDVAVLNGALLADGIIGPGLSFAEAERLIEANVTDRSQAVRMVEASTAYGCNMAVNLRLVGVTRFDETLPLYAWQEDVDFSARLKRFGRVVRIDRPAGVHLGVKSGRISGLRFGYSQVVNPIYLLRKGTMTPRHASWLIGKNVAMNLLRAIWAEPYLDRRGRLRGNIVAVIDMLRGRGHPDRIFKF